MHQTFNSSTTVLCCSVHCPGDATADWWDCYGCCKEQSHPWPPLSPGEKDKWTCQAIWVAGRFATTEHQWWTRASVLQSHPAVQAPKCVFCCPHDHDLMFPPATRRWSLDFTKGVTPSSSFVLLRPPSSSFVLLRPPSSSFVLLPRFSYSSFFAPFFFFFIMSAFLHLSVFPLHCLFLLLPAPWHYKHEWASKYGPAGQTRTRTRASRENATIDAK